MTNFLTSQDIQELISVDRSTVYRMAEDGRLPGVKVGRQWRFPADQVAARLGVTGVTSASAQRSTDGTGLDRLLRPEVAQSVADLIGELFGVMAVITDMDGRPVTSVANPCGYFAAIADQPGAVEACLSQWRRFVDAPNMAPRWVSTHLGFLCARTFIWVARVPVGMIVVGGVRPVAWPPQPEVVESIAAEAMVPVSILHDTIDELWSLDLDRQRQVLRLLPQMGDLISQLTSARNELIAHLGPAAPPHRTHRTDRTHHRTPLGGDRT
jgi:excisionase family DNA binding protein